MKLVNLDKYWDSIRERVDKMKDEDMKNTFKVTGHDKFSGTPNVERAVKVTEKEIEDAVDMIFGGMIGLNFSCTRELVDTLTMDLKYKLGFRNE